MVKNEIPAEYSYCVERCINYMLNHLGNDLSLDVLAGVANYSPFHFQKIFKLVKGESPKQYVARLRLEIAAHYLIIHNKRPVSAIALDCGFSSPAVFARSFKQFFGITAEEMRNLPEGKRATVRGTGNHLKKLLDRNNGVVSYTNQKPTEIVVKTMPAQYGFCMNTGFEDLQQVEKQLREMTIKARAHDLWDANSTLMGIIYPHNNIYRPFICVPKNKTLPKGMHRWEIKGGKFATFIVQGEVREVFERIHYFYNTWLPANGYKIADIYGIEIFKGDTSLLCYKEVVRELCIPIEPA
ncbi:MAG TPA: AraC family transcriptional regulator [Flavobacteriales bacterium]|nr:AraC family transcriptional regulator [Flavobacteriales bacterium]